MDGHIGHLHCCYRVIGVQGSAGLITGRLERLAKERLAEAWEETLDQALGDDPTVYVLRSVRTGLAINTHQDLTDTYLARRWGERLAGAVVRYIASDPDDGTNLVRFADQADYVAHFITDLIEGRAWRHWFYGSFASLKPRSTGDALWTVLQDNHDHLPAILGHLHRYDVLEKLLSHLDEASLRWLWSQGLSAYLILDPQTARPIFAQAMHLVDQLGLWAQLHPQEETLFQAYLATGPPAADWRDRRGLSVAFFDLLRFLADQGYLRRSDQVGAETLSDRLDQSLLDFDWLDTAWLRAALLGLLTGPELSKTELPVRPARHGPTPRQRDLLADLTSALLESGIWLDNHHPDSPSNALRLYALLIARAPRWADDAIVPGLIQRLLAAWRWLAQAHPSTEAIRRLHQGDIEGALHMLPDANRASAAAAFKVMADLGEPGLVMVETLARDERLGPAVGEIGIETGCAGVYLLLRAILDARLPLLVEGTSFPPRRPDAKHIEGSTPLGAFLLALGLRGAGEPGLVDGEIDAGLGPLAGLERPPAFEALREAWPEVGSADHDRFLASLLRILASQRLVNGSAIHLYRVPLIGNKVALVAGDETSNLWPLGRIIERTTDIGEVLLEWLDVWQETTGHWPAALVCDEALADTTNLQFQAETPRVVIVPDVKISGAGHAPDELAETHRTGREALLEALSALDHSRLALPEVDLTVALTASALLRVWARWLRQFSTSSVPYLLANFIRRPGRVTMDTDQILVELESGPFDVVLDMAGYTANLEHVPWLGGRRVRFIMRGS